VKNRILVILAWEIPALLSMIGFLRDDALEFFCVLRSEARYVKLVGRIIVFYWILVCFYLYFVNKIKFFVGKIKLSFKIGVNICFFVIYY